MTWLEIIFFLAPLIIFVSACCAVSWIDYDLGNVILTVGMLGWIFGSLITMAVQEQYCNPVVTSQYKIENVNAFMTDTGLSVTTPNGTQAFFKEVKDTEKWRKGGEFYMTYYFTKRNLGFDTDEAAIIIK